MDQSIPIDESKRIASSPPAWDQVPPARRRELTATLATLILKQLPARAPSPREDPHEQDSAPAS